MSAEQALVLVSSLDSKDQSEDTLIASVKAFAKDQYRGELTYAEAEALLRKEKPKTAIIWFQKGRKKSVGVRFSTGEERVSDDGKFDFTHRSLVATTDGLSPGLFLYPFQSILELNAFNALPFVITRTVHDVDSLKTVLYLDRQKIEEARQKVLQGICYENVGRVLSPALSADFLRKHTTKDVQFLITPMQDPLVFQMVWLAEVNFGSTKIRLSTSARGKLKIELDNWKAEFSTIEEIWAKIRRMKEEETEKKAATEALGAAIRERILQVVKTQSKDFYKDFKGLAEAETYLKENSTVDFIVCPHWDLYKRNNNFFVIVYRMAELEFDCKDVQAFDKNPIEFLSSSVVKHSLGEIHQALRQRNREEKQKKEEKLRQVMGNSCYKKDITEKDMAEKYLRENAEVDFIVWHESSKEELLKRGYKKESFFMISYRGAEEKMEHRVCSLSVEKGDVKISIRMGVGIFDYVHGFSIEGLWKEIVRRKSSQKTTSGPSFPALNQHIVAGEMEMIKKKKEEILIPPHFQQKITTTESASEFLNKKENGEREFIIWSNSKGEFNVSYRVSSDSIQSLKLEFICTASIVQLKCSHFDLSKGAGFLAHSLDELSNKLRDLKKPTIGTFV